MLETVFNTRAMEFIPQLAEPAVRLHLLVVDADAAVRSACAEIAASLGYAVESTGDLGQARSQMRGRAADILLVNLPAGLEPGPGTGLRGQAALSGHLGDRHDRLGLSECGSGGDALRRIGLPDQTICDGRALDGAGPGCVQPHDGHRDPPVARAAQAFARSGRHDRPLRGDGEAIPHSFQGRSKLAPGIGSWRERDRQRVGGADHPRLRS